MSAFLSSLPPRPRLSRSAKILTLVRHDEDQGRSVFHGFDEVRNSDDIVRQLNFRQVLLVDVRRVDDLCQFLALELDLADMSQQP